MNVPIQNVYYLLLYAWEHIGDAGETAVLPEGVTELQDLFAHVLADATARLVARGLDRGYLPREEPIRGVRGKLELTATLKRNLLPAAQTQCTFDELRHDVLHNQIIKATLRLLLDAGLDRRIQDRVRRVYRKLDFVSDIRVAARDFGRVQLHRNNRLYDLALNVCRMVHENLMVEAGTGRAQFLDFRANEQKMGALFEEFVRSFLRREQRTYRVTSPQISWRDAAGTPRDLGFLPVMRTDVVLESPERCLVVDTKFYRAPLSTHHHGAPKLNSGNLYQILTYVRHHTPRAGTTGPVEGMLLYPVVRECFSFDYRIEGHDIAIRSIDLDQPWTRIHSDLLAIFA